MSQDIKNIHKFISFKEFSSYFKSQFWRKLKESVVPYEKIANKSNFLEEVYNSLPTYAPNAPREYIVSNKHNLVTRIVPTFTRVDICVYFFSIKVLENILCDPNDRVSGTFGGWTLGNGLKNEEADEKKYTSHYFDGMYGSDTSYNPYAWRKHWQDFQNLAYKYSEYPNANVIIKFDIANFYDCINLNLLEALIKEEGLDNKETLICDLLFKFLRQWNFLIEGKQDKTVGIPQDEIADCSRILANFYLRSYDRYLHETCSNNSCHYLRYSDDQLIFAPSLKIAKASIFEASKFLFKIGLNLNSSKVIIFEDKDKYKKYWAFQIFDLLSDKDTNNINNIEKACELYFSWDKKNFRYTQVLRRLLAFSTINKIKPSIKYKLFSEILSDEFLANGDARQFNCIYKFSDETQRKELMTALYRLSDQILYNSYHYQFRKFLVKYLKYKETKLLDYKIRQISLISNT